MSPDVAQMLLGLLAQVQLPGNDPDLLEKAALVIQARKELEAAITPPAG